jgi:FkbM family methyltransferase
MLSKRHWSPALYGLTRSLYHYGFPRSAYRRLASQRWRETEIEMSLLPVLVNPARAAIDVGANVGHYAVDLAGLAPQVHAFEAHPRLAYILRHNMPGNVTVHNAAVSDQTGTATLSVPFFDRPVEGMASLTPTGGQFSTAQMVSRVVVRSTTLNQFAAHNIGFVKIDVEGHEAAVLAGAHELIDRQRPTFLIEVEERHRAGAVQAAFDYFQLRDYIGLFARNTTIHPISDFHLSMQHIADIVPDAPRVSSGYVNNFIFVPREHYSAAQHKQLIDRLHAARAE